MKRIVKILIIGTAFLSAGCADLDETLRTGITAETYYSTAVGFEDLAEAQYYPIQVKYGDYNNIWDHGTDIWTYGSGAREYLNSYESGLNPSATSRNWYAIWVAYFKGINLANSVIGRADDVVDMSDERKKTLVAEARFLRALYYDHLVETHGGVPLNLEETVGVVTEAYPATEDEIWKVVKEDLEFAAANLPVTQSEVGRATSGAAKHLLARVNLTTKNWSEAAKWAKEVIDSKQYSLIASYYQLWDPYQSHSGKGYNAETIFGLLITPTSGINARDQKSRRFAARVRTVPGLQATFYIGNEVSRHKPTPFLVHEIFNNDPDRTDVPNQWNDERWTTGFKLVWRYNNPKTLPKGATLGDTAVFLPTEKRFEQMTDAEAAAYSKQHNFRMYRMKDWTTEIWPSLALKFRMRGDDSPEMSLAALGDYNPAYFWRTEPIFRLGETYLIAAEAYMMMGGAANLDKAAEYFNAIRKRAEVPGTVMPLITPAQLNIDEILNERHRELTGEYLTWYDLKRTGKLLERVRKYNKEAAPYIQEYHMLRPIPQEQIDRCTNEYPQTPGY